MSKGVFNKIGWIILLGMGVTWLLIGYSSWYLSLLPLAFIAFSISDGSIKKVGRLQQLSLAQILLILFAFIASVAIVFSLIQIANYLINDVLHLTGGIKTMTEIIAIILALYPVKFTFGSIVYKVIGNLKATT